MVILSRKQLVQFFENLSSYTKARSSRMSKRGAPALCKCIAPGMTTGSSLVSRLSDTVALPLRPIVLRKLV